MTTAPTHTVTCRRSGRRPATVLAWLACAALATACAVSVGGCAVAGVMADRLRGPTVIPAAFELPERPTAVVVESYSVGQNAMDSDVLASLITAQLENYRVAPMVPQHRVYDLRVADPKHFRTLTIAQIARAVAAEQVIYVDLRSADIDGPLGTRMVKGELTAYVKVVSAADGVQMWPKQSSEGEAISLETGYIEQSDGVDSLAVRERLTRAAAMRIATLFFNYTPPDSD